MVGDWESTTLVDMERQLRLGDPKLGRGCIRLGQRLAGHPPVPRDGRF